MAATRCSTVPGERCWASLALFGFGLLGLGVALVIAADSGGSAWLIDRQSSSGGLTARRFGRGPDLFWHLGYLLSLGMTVFSAALVG